MRYLLLTLILFLPACIEKRNIEKEIRDNNIRLLDIIVKADENHDMFIVLSV